MINFKKSTITKKSIVWDCEQLVNGDIVLKMNGFYVLTIDGTNGTLRRIGGCEDLKENGLQIDKFGRIELEENV